MRTLLFFATAGVLAACGTPSKESTEKSRYSYSNSFVIADTSNLRLVRKWNNALVAGKIDQALSYIADSVEIVFSDGTRYSTTKDSIRKVIVQMLAPMRNLSVGFIAGVPVTATDKNDTWVLSYTDESYTAEGKDVRYIAHELYRIISGKIRNVYAYSQQPSSVDQPVKGGGEKYSYSGSFEMLSNDYLDIMTGWYDALLSKNYDQARTYLADSVTVFFDDGTRMNTVKDSLVAVLRNVVESADITIEFGAAMSVKSMDQNDEYILAWYNETVSTAEGVEKAIYHEVYQIENNKIRTARVFKRKPPKE